VFVYIDTLVMIFGYDFFLKQKQNIKHVKKIKK